VERGNWRGLIELRFSHRMLTAECRCTCSGWTEVPQIKESEMFAPDSLEAYFDPVASPGCSFDVVAQRWPTSGVSTVIMTTLDGHTAHLRTSHKLDWPPGCRSGEGLVGYATVP
jgi:hypothetical protein